MVNFLEFCDGLIQVVHDVALKLVDALCLVGEHRRPADFEPVTLVLHLFLRDIRLYAPSECFVVQVG